MNTFSTPNGGLSIERTRTKHLYESRWKLDDDPGNRWCALGQSTDQELSCLIFQDLQKTWREKPIPAGSDEETFKPGVTRNELLLLIENASLAVRLHQQIDELIEIGLVIEETVAGKRNLFKGNIEFKRFIPKT